MCSSIVVLTVMIYPILSCFIFAKLSDEESFHADDNLRYENSLDEENFDKSNPAAFGSEGPFVGKPFTFNNKKSPFVELKSDAENSPTLQKRQVGVVYQNEIPIGILQPYQRSYRFVPVKEDTSSSVENLDKLANEFGKRDTQNAFQSEENYPSILTNFKIVNKLYKKRSDDLFSDENVQDLKETIRKLRSSDFKRAQIEEQLKNILDDMGLIEDIEEKREIANEDDTDDTMLRKRETNDYAVAETERKIKNDVNIDGSSNLVENLKNSGDLMLSGNKLPLASHSDVDKRSSEEEINEDARIEKGIQRKIESLKEQVKREISALKNQKEERRKRQAFDNLISEESDELNPAMHFDETLKPLDRKRRNVNLSKKKHNGQKIEERNEDSEEAGELFGDEDFEDSSGRFRRQDTQESLEKLIASILQKSRFRRRINEDQSPNRAQQLSDMSPVDLFGALPKSYDGELSRYKRVKRQ